MLLEGINISSCIGPWLRWRLLYLQSSQAGIHSEASYSSICIYIINYNFIVCRLALPPKVWNYRRCTKYSNPFYPVQPPHPPKFNVIVTWSALAPVNEKNQTRNTTFANTRAETLRFWGAGVQHSACCRVWICCPSTVVREDTHSYATSEVQHVWGWLGIPHCRRQKWRCWARLQHHGFCRATG